MITLTNLLKEENIKIIERWTKFFSFKNPRFIASNEVDALYILVDTDDTTDMEPMYKSYFVDAHLMDAFNCNVFVIISDEVGPFSKDDVFEHCADIRDVEEIKRVYQLKFPSKTTDTISFSDPPPDRIEDMNDSLKDSAKRFDYSKFPKKKNDTDSSTTTPLAQLGKRKRNENENEKNPANPSSYQQPIIKKPTGTKGDSLKPTDNGSGPEERQTPE